MAMCNLTTENNIQNYIVVRMSELISFDRFIFNCLCCNVIAQEGQRHGGKMKMIVSFSWNLLMLKAGKEYAISLFFSFMSISIDISLYQMYLDDSARNNWISTNKWGCGLV